MKEYLIKANAIATTMVCKKVLMVFLLIASLSATAQSWQDTSAMINAILNRFRMLAPWDNWQ